MYIIYIYIYVYIYIHIQYSLVPRYTLSLWSGLLWRLFPRLACGFASHGGKAQLGAILNPKPETLNPSRIPKPRALTL